ncbi:cell wall hydrolase [Sphingosinithalassobacter sp. LHW66-3]|uniref:cell wall hydrolase n=1 Tax=Sphingosinithalassobacter sp. LHW66-3 TaxID=3424718 RepID=UPI003D6B8AC9
MASGTQARPFWRRFTRMQARGVGAAVLVSLVGAGFSAQALGPAEPIRAEAPPAPAGYEADDHFPGAAYFFVVDDETASAGTTGTAPLPDLPVPADAVIDASIYPAAPFASRGSGTDKARAVQCLTTAIYYEAANEPDAGQRAVAQVVLNRVRHPAFPATVCGVVFQGSDRPVCQFSFACDGSMTRRPSSTAWQRAERVAKAALSGSVFAPVGLATHYHTHAVTPSWNRSLVMTGVFGAHFFHRWKGYWGTPAAFRDRYRGGEPAPGPSRSAAQVQASPAAAPEAAVPAVRPSPPSDTAIQPRHRQTSTLLAETDVPELPQSTILPKWEGTGQPLR